MSRPGWAGSNVDVGTVAEIDAELQHRVVTLDELLAEGKAAQEALGEAKRAYLVAYARSITRSNQKTNSGKERDAKTENVELRVAYENAELRWKLAQMALDVGQSQLTGVQTRAGMLRGQMQLDGTAPSYAGRKDSPPAAPARQAKAPF